MVYVNSKKFACESCIKGHRSSSCHHTDRPLFEIKKKGRPVSQCEKCRELRQSKKVHSKCTCNPKPDPASRGEVLASATSKSRRYIPIVPALPNGLRDVLAASQVRTSLPADARQRVDALLNPCNCKSVWKCDCRQAQLSSSTDKSSSEFTGDLGTLAHVATMRRNDASTAALMPLGRTAKIALPRTISLPSTSPKRHTSRPSSPQQDSHKRLKHHHCHNHNQHLPRGPSPALELPPIHSSLESPPIVNQIPDFGFMPPISTIASLAGSGCTCGVECACPGCVEHRGPEHAAKDIYNCCADGQCQTCVDNQSGFTLQSSTSPFSSIPAASTSASVASSSLDFINKSASLDRFFARAAALPPPPPYRRLGNGIQLDPCDFKYGPGKTPQVNLPKLCCGGRCSCPNGHCLCGASCGGSCADADSFMARGDAGNDSAGELSPSSLSSLDASVASPSLNVDPYSPARNCCCGGP